MEPEKPEVRQQYPNPAPDPVAGWAELLNPTRRDIWFVGETSGAHVDQSLERPDVPLK